MAAIFQVYVLREELINGGNTAEEMGKLPVNILVINVFLQSQIVHLLEFPWEYVCFLNVTWKIFALLLCKRSS